MVQEEVSVPSAAFEDGHEAEAGLWVCKLCACAGPRGVVWCRAVRGLCAREVRAARICAILSSATLTLRPETGALDLSIPTSFCKCQDLEEEAEEPAPRQDIPGFWGFRV